METKNTKSSSLLFKPENLSKLLATRPSTGQNSSENKKHSKNKSYSKSKSYIEDKSNSETIISGINKVPLKIEYRSYSPTRVSVFPIPKPKQSKYENSFPKKKILYQEYTDGPSGSRKKDSEKTKPSAQEIITHKLSNIDNMEELFKVVTANKKKLDSLYNLKGKKEENKNKGTSSIKSFEDQQFYKKLDSMNDFLGKQESMLGKKKRRWGGRGSKEGVGEITFDRREKFCSDCMCMHLPGKHLNPNRGKLYRPDRYDNFE